MPAAPATAILTTTTDEPTAIPLTTIYTPPTWCSAVPYTFLDVSSGTSRFLKNQENLGDPTTAKCYPPNYALQHSSGVTAQYSPGVCPSGYSGIPRTQGNGVSTSICCPSGASWYNNTLPGDCHSTVSTSTTAIVGSTTIVLNTPAVFFDYYLQIAWASSDLDQFTPASAPILATITSAASSSASAGNVTAASSSSSATPTSSSPGLSGGAIAGIVVGALAVIALTLCGVFLCLWWKKRTAERAADSVPPAGHTTYGPVWQLNPHGVSAELTDGGRGEYHEKPHELAASNKKKPSGTLDTRSELPAS